MRRRLEVTWSRCVRATGTSSSVRCSSRWTAVTVSKCPTVGKSGASTSLRRQVGRTADGIGIVITTDKSNIGHVFRQQHRQKAETRSDIKQALSNQTFHDPLVDGGKWNDMGNRGR